MPPAAKSDFGPFNYVQDWKNLREETGWWHSFELPDGTEIRGVCALDGLKNRIAQFPIPSDLRGKRVLDIGAWDGWYSFEMERRGAEVMAIDCWDNPRFREMHEILGSRVDYRQYDIYELTPDLMGRFDIVLFLGVLYHLKHPLLALERVCALTTDLAAVDSFILREEHRPGRTLESATRDGVLRNRRVRRANRQLGWTQPALPAGVLPHRRLRACGVAQPLWSTAHVWLVTAAGRSPRSREIASAAGDLSSLQLRNQFPLRPG